MKHEMFDCEECDRFGGRGSKGTHARVSNDERARALFREAFSPIDAPDDMAERVIRMAGTSNRNMRGHRVHRIPMRAVVIGATLSAALVGGGAYAAVQSNFFQSAFGDKGQEDVKARDIPVEGKDSTCRLAEMTWVQTDPANAERILGDYVGTVGQSVSINDYTLTVDEMVVDENGIGVATYTLSNPDGVGEVDGYYGQFGFMPDAPVRGVHVEGATQRDIGNGMTAGISFDERSVKDEALSTETELHAVQYFCPLFGEHDENGYMWQLSMWDEESGSLAGPTITYAPETSIPATAFAAETGETVSMSPLGMVASESIETTDPGSYRRCVVTFSDGTEYIVKDDRYYEFDDKENAPELAGNTVLTLDSGSDGIFFVFNRLVDVEAVASVTFETNAGEQLVLTR